MESKWRAVQTQCSKILLLIKKGRCVAEQGATLQRAADHTSDQPMWITDLVKLHVKVKPLYQVQIAKEEKLRIQEWR